jgi:hypothetical protein
MAEATPFGALRQDDKKKPQPQRVGRTIVMQKAAGFRTQFANACAKYVPGAIQYALFLGGLASISVGFWMAWKPLGPIVGGGIAVYVGMLLSVDEKK